MNAISPKNKIIEYSVKYNVKSPIFETFKVSGTDHNPIFKSCVTFLNSTIESTGYGKKQAEFNACSLFLEKIQLKDSSYTDWLISRQELLNIAKNFNCIKLYDGDNIQTIPLGDNTLKIISCSNTLSVKKRFERLQKPINTYLLLCPINGQDANDHYITFIYGGLKAICQENTIFEIVSEDHFAISVNKF